MKLGLTFEQIQEYKSPLLSGLAWDFIPFKNHEIRMGPIYHGGHVIPHLGGIPRHVVGDNQRPVACGEGVSRLEKFWRPVFIGILTLQCDGTVPTKAM